MNRYSYSSIRNVPAEKAAILTALESLPTSVVPSMHFGRGESAELFMAQLRKPDFWNTPCQKHFRDQELKGSPKDASFQKDEGR